jgi:diguanylate cyclase (GGDEF)-like protein
LNPLKIIIPAFFIFTLVVLAYLYATALPIPLQNILPILPYVLAVAVLFMAIYFNLGHLFYLSLSCFVSWMLFEHGLLTEPITINLIIIAVTLSILVMGLLQEKGLLAAAWLRHLLIFFILLGTYALWKKPPQHLNFWLESAPLPVTWFNWTLLNQSTWFLALITLTSLAWLFIQQKKRQAFDALVILSSILILTHFTKDPLATAMTCNAGLFILLFSALQKSWQLAYVDALTKLPGRRALEEKLQRSLGIYALAMVDIDHFKSFNDSYGHDVGDDVLRMIAAKIGQVGGGGKAFRYGGEEFTVVFNNHGADEVKAHLQALIDTVAATPFVVNRRKSQQPKTVQVTISIGLTDSIHKANANQTIKVADEALYHAKKKGRNRLTVKT